MSQEIPAPDQLTTDIAVVGSGGAGLMCVLHALETDPSLDVTMVSKGAPPCHPIAPGHTTRPTTLPEPWGHCG